MIKELIEKMMKQGRATEYGSDIWKTAGSRGYNEALGDFYKIIQPYKIYDELIEKVSSWWDEVYFDQFQTEFDQYPADIFTGVSGDDGAIKVAEIRELLDKIKIFTRAG